jgi:hypothetical protein
MLVHGMNDPRVDVWNSGKAAARLQVASSSGKPVFMRLDGQAGHGVGSTAQQAASQRADIYSPAVAVRQGGPEALKRRGEPGRMATLTLLDALLRATPLALLLLMAAVLQRDRAFTRRRWPAWRFRSACPCR